MIAPLPATKLIEVIDYFGVSGFKDLNPFSLTGKKKTELKKSMMGLMGNNPADAHTGLGIIYAYENQFELALREFRSAYLKSKAGFHQTRHLANYLFVYGDYEEAIKLYLSIINNSNEEVFNDIANRLITYCFKDELKKIFNESIYSRNISEDLTDKILKMNDLLFFLNKYNIPLDFYRDVINVHNRVFYKYYSLPTISDISYYHEWDQQSISYSIDLDFKSVGENYELIGNMNDDLQDMLINVYTDHKITLGSDQDRITVYFKLADEVAA